MKKSVLKSVLAAIAVVMMSCTTTANAQTGNTKYIYGQNDTNTTVYTLNEDTIDALIAQMHKDREKTAKILL